MYYDRFVLGRLQGVNDDWYRLPTYQGWRICPHYGKPDVFTPDDDEVVKGGRLYLNRPGVKKPKIPSFFYGPESLSVEKFEIFQALAREVKSNLETVFTTAKLL